MRQELTARRFEVLGVVNGEPKRARRALQQIAASGRRLNLIACTQTTSTWLVLSDVNLDFPQIGPTRLVTPQPYRWPNFLKSDNLLNIANQIAVIAIVAIGQTVVIITAGIDLSVGSLIALSAVASTLLIRDFAGAEQAGTAGMLLACLGGIALAGLIGAFSGITITLFGVPPFIATLGMMLFASGVAYILSQGQSVYQVPDSFVWLGRGADLFGIPNAVGLMLVLYAVAHLLTARSVWGRYVY
ncbi:MAG TPA: ABC transporter permease, partial [Planctomycetaceae bacterium]|nr:ABC transporter permease [Planctomycetaceae bacterium]